MSISSTVRKAGPFTGNAITTAFPFAYKVFQASDVLVVQTDLSGVQTTKTLTTDYTVALNANQDSNPGGTVNMLVAPPTGFLLTLGSQVSQTQPMVLTNTGGFFPTTLNDAADRATILIQQMNEQLNRAVYIPFSSTANTALPSPSANTLLAWNAAGNAIVNLPINSGAVVSAAMLPVVTAVDLPTAQAALLQGDIVVLGPDTGRFGTSGLRMRTSAANTSTAVDVMPNGTGASAVLRLANKDDVSGGNVGFAELAVATATPTVITLNGIAFGTGTAPTTFSTNMNFTASGAVSGSAGGAPSTAANSAQIWSSRLTLTDSSRTADNRYLDLLWSAGTLNLQFVNDAFAAGQVIMTATGGYAAGVTGITFGTAITVPGGAAFIKTNTALNNGAGAGAGTITNAPAAGNPTKWVPINDNGTTRYIPAW